MAGDEMVCDECGGLNVDGWSAPNDLWNRVTGSPYGILCPQCFTRRAADTGAHTGPWRLMPVRPNDGATIGVVI
jgi:hypothetical protein